MARDPPGRRWLALAAQGEAADALRQRARRSRRRADRARGGAAAGGLSQRGRRSTARIAPPCCIRTSTTHATRCRPAPFRFPTADMNFVLRAAEPLGPSLVVAFLTEKQVNLLELGIEGRDAAGKMQQVFTEVCARATRALVVEARENQICSRDARRSGSIRRRIRGGRLPCHQASSLLVLRRAAGGVAGGRGAAAVSSCCRRASTSRSSPRAPRPAPHSDPRAADFNAPTITVVKPDAHAPDPASGRHRRALPAGAGAPRSTSARSRSCTGS